VFMSLTSELSQARSPRHAGRDRAYSPGLSHDAARQITTTIFPLASLDSLTRCTSRLSLSGCEQSIDRQRTRASQNQHEQPGDIQEIDLVSGWAELRPVGCQPDGVDGAEAVTQMDREHRHEHQDNQRNAHDRYERPGQDRQAAENLDERGHPGRQLRQWRANLIHQPDELRWPSTELGPPVSDEPVSDHQAERQRCPLSPQNAGSLLEHFDLRSAAIPLSDPVATT